ncbi:MAG: hypothetical protein K1X88_13765 [Nannocystaceae bacterium]|nr:hypothetical protein [Nannocystaceae bacterium]
MLGVGALAACNDDGTQVTGDSSSSGSSSSDGTTVGSLDSSSTSTAADSSSSSGVADSSTSVADSSSGSTTTDASTTTSAESSSSSTATTVSSGSSSDTGNTGACPVDALGPAVPDSLFGNSFGDDDAFSGSCGGAGSPDAAYTFTAPADGVYTFDTAGSGLDTVLYVLDGTCSGTELGCNDDGAGSQSALALPLVSGQTVTVVVDGNAAVGGPFSLHVNGGSLACPIEDLGNTVPNAISGDTSMLFDGFAGSCGGQAGPDAAYLFTAPAAGTYTFDTFGSSFSSFLYVLDGNCSGSELACGSQGVLADLQAGQQVTIVVDSLFESGTFDLHIDTLGGACPDSDLGNTVPQSIPGTTAGGDNTAAGSCGGDFSPDSLYLFTAPQDGLYQFDTFGSPLDTVVYLRDGGCGGPELDCNDDVTPGNADSRVVEGLAAGQQVMVAVDGNGIGAYTFNVDLVPCPDETAASTTPQTLNDSTTGGIDKLHGSCSSGGPGDESADYAYSFTAPADGTYTFDTLGTFFDTLLYVLDGPACNAPELACNDNYQFDQGSALSLPLVAGQTIVVVVDGNFDSQGAFGLHVGQLDGTCPDEDLGNVVPTTVMDTTANADNAATGSCGGLTGNDVSYTWTAPADGLYRFDTTGSAYPALLYVRDQDCGGVELDCDFEQFGTSISFAQLVQDQTVVVTIDGEGQSGNFTLTIDEAPPGGDCCIAHDGTGCAVPEIEDCVCAIDGFCCDTGWDDLCADEAVNPCGAGC